LYVRDLALSWERSSEEVKSWRRMEIWRGGVLRCRDRIPSSGAKDMSRDKKVEASKVMKRWRHGEDVTECHLFTLQ